MEFDNQHNVNGQHHLNNSNPGNGVVFVKEYKKHDCEAQESLNSNKDNFSNVCEPTPGCSHW